MATTANLIKALYPAKSTSLLVAAASYATILVYINTNHVADARTLMFRLLDYTFTQFNAGKLVGGFSLTTRQNLLAFETGLYCTVGLPTAGLTLPGDPTNTGTVNQVVFPSTTTQNVVTPDGNSGVQLPPNSFNTPAVVVAISVITGNTHPLNTTLDQYGPFYDVKVTPETGIISNLTVGLCVPNFPDNTSFLAHNVGLGIQVLEPGGSFPALGCTPALTMGAHEMLELALRGQVGRASKALGSAIADFVLPTNAWAGSGGKTGLTKSFSPFGVVDTKVYQTANSVTTQTSPAGSAVAAPPSTIVKTKNLTPVQKVNVLFSVTNGGGTVAGGSSATVSTDANGVATVGNWIVNAGPNAVQAVGTFADPAVTFAPRTNTTYPQNVAVDPVAGLSYTATGGDVVPYGSSYLILDGAHGIDPTFFTVGFSTAGSNQNGPFGTSSTSCPLNSDPAINTAFAVNTDLLLIKTFPLPSGWTSPLTIEAAIDNDIAVWVNGHALTTLNGVPFFTFSGADAGNYAFDPTSGFVTHENCATKGSLTFTVPAAYLLTGQNTLAIRAQDRGGLSYVDAKVTAPVPAPPSP